MDEWQYLWDHFKFNAEQRLKGFNFFVLLSIFATAFRVLIFCQFIFGAGVVVYGAIRWAC